MKKFVILISVYNDWESVFKLIENIDLQISSWDAEISVLIVNDASTDIKPKVELNFKKIKSVRILNMKKNKGHARCNALGLRFIDLRYMLSLIVSFLSIINLALLIYCFFLFKSSLVILNLEKLSNLNR